MYSVGLIDVPKNDPRYFAHDNAPGLIRVIDRRTSEDGLHWSDRKRVLVPDEADPTDQQFYYLAVTHTERGRVGMLGHYRVEAQTMDLEWCFSKDGITWERPVGRPGFPGASRQNRTATASTPRTPWSSMRTSGGCSTQA